MRQRGRSAVARGRPQRALQRSAVRRRARAPYDPPPTAARPYPPSFFSEVAFCVFCGVTTMVLALIFILCYWGDVTAVRCRAHPCGCSPAGWLAGWLAGWGERCWVPRVCREAGLPFCRSGVLSPAYDKLRLPSPIMTRRCAVWWPW